MLNRPTTTRTMPKFELYTGTHHMYLREGERIADPTSTKHEFVGAGVVRYTRHSDGGLTVHMDDTTARRYHA